MTLKNFSSGVNTNFSTQLNRNFAFGITQAGINKINQLTDRAVTQSAGAIEGFAEAYTDSTGRADSVDTSILSSAVYKSTVQYPSFSTTGAEEGNGAHAAAAGTNSITTTITPNVDCIVTMVKFTVTAGAPYYQGITISQGGAILAYKNVSVPTNTTITCTFSASDYISPILTGSTFTITIESSGGTFNFDATESYSGTIYTISSQSVPTGTNMLGLTATKLSSDGEILHTIPASTFSSTASSSILVPKIVNWESGADIKYKLLKVVNSIATSAQTYDTVTQTSDVRDLKFSSDGTKMYVLNFANDTIYQYTLSSAFDISSASYASKSFSVTAQEATPTSFCFNSAGSKMYACGSTNDIIYQYTLSTPWDISTASYATISLNISATILNPSYLFLGSSGTKLYVNNGGGSGCKIIQYTLGTPDNISTGTSDSKHYDTQGISGNLRGITFSSDGLNCYFKGSDGIIRQLVLSSSWDVSTAAYTHKLYSSFGGSFYGLQLNADGTKIYGCTSATSVGTLVLNTAYDILTYSTTESTGWLDCGSTPIISNFTALTNEPNMLIVKLIPKTSSPTSGYPAINGIYVRAE